MEADIAWQNDSYGQSGDCTLDSSSYDVRSHTLRTMNLMISIDWTANSRGQRTGVMSVVISLRLPRPRESKHALSCLVASCMYRDVNRVTKTTRHQSTILPPALANFVCIVQLKNDDQVDARNFNQMLQ